jgi:mannose-6-phosphate isomerase-like protein (cupin superfamily)
MKIFKLPKLAESAVDGSFCLGSHELDSNAVYMLYSRLRPGDAPRKVAHADGSEEIIFVLKGNIRVRCGKMDFVVGPGEAFHSKECASFQLENIGSDDAVFIAAGGRANTKTGKPVEKEPEPVLPEEKEAEAVEEEQEFFITREDEP